MWCSPSHQIERYHHQQHPPPSLTTRPVQGWKTAESKYWYNNQFVTIDVFFNQNFPKFLFWYCDVFVRPVMFSVHSHCLKLLSILHIIKEKLFTFYQKLFNVTEEIDWAFLTLSGIFQRVPEAEVGCRSDDDFCSVIRGGQQRQVKTSVGFIVPVFKPPLNQLPDCCSLPASLHSPVRNVSWEM